MVVRTYHESQGKPIYTIKAKINFEDEDRRQETFNDQRLDRKM
jgi:hypothetical protein